MHQPIHQLSRQQAWALYELHRHAGRVEFVVHLRTLRSLERAGLIVHEAPRWPVTAAGEREAERAGERLKERIS
jgi:predicted transcriptional regulator